MKLRSRQLFWSLCAVAVLWVIAGLAHAQPSQEDVFKSISDNMGAKTDNTHFIAGMAIVAGTAILIGIFNRKKSPAVAKAALNNPAKLMKEVIRATSLRPAEVKYLRMLAERESIESPLTFMLCPSVLLQAARNGTSKAEKRVLVQLTRKLGISLQVARPPQISMPTAAQAKAA